MGECEAHKELSLLVVGTAVPLKVFYAGPELHRGELGQVVGQPLPVQTQAEAVFPHQGAVAVNNLQMIPKVQTTNLRFFS